MKKKEIKDPMEAFLQSSLANNFTTRKEIASPSIPSIVYTDAEPSDMEELQRYNFVDEITHRPHPAFLQVSPLADKLPQQQDLGTQFAGLSEDQKEMFMPTRKEATYAGTDQLGDFYEEMLKDPSNESY